MTYAAGTFRIWDGIEWRYGATEWTEPAYEIIKEGAVSSLIATTTTATRSPASVAQGNPVTVTASTTGRNGGNLVFYRRIGTGAWAEFATKAAPAGGGSVTASQTPLSTNTTYYVKFTGSSTHAPSSSPVTPSTTVTAPSSSTKTVNKSWHQAYNGSGGRISGSGRDSAIHQGYYSGTHGNRKSLLRFDPNLPAGANVTKVVLKCNAAWEHWYQNSGGTIILGYFTDQNTEPSSWPSAKVHTNRGRKAVDTGSWSVDISSWANGALERSDFSGITIGPGPSTSTEYYGYSQGSPDANDFQLVVTYKA